ncbi:MAG: DUF285 domain-containing protein [Bacteroidales bacterium]|nr:DUF285 domain-containing protein [Bacteroidales bacterium]
MRHNILILAACILGASMLFGSCDERIESEGNIGFTADVASFNGGYVGTKGEPIGDPLLDPDTYVTSFQTKHGANGFKVSAYKGATAKFTDATSKFTNGTWTLTPGAKWYSGETLDFYAITQDRGISNQNVNASAKQMTFDYSVPSTKVWNQPDVMVGYYSGPGVVETDNLSVRIAPLTFYHPLAAVRLIAGNIAGQKVREAGIFNIYGEGTCTADMSGTAPTFSWEFSSTATPNSFAAFPYEGDPVAVEGQFLGGESEALMVIPQTLGENAYFEVGMVNPDADDDPSTQDEMMYYRVSLKDVQLKAGTILNITVNLKGVDIVIDVNERPLGLVIPWDPLEVTARDFTLVPTMAYLCSGAEFRDYMNSLGTVTEIIFDREGQVDESGLEIQDSAHPEGYPIYATFNNGVVRITTHANTIQAHQSLKGMFKDMTSLTKITWGLFFDTEQTTDMSEMFMGCTGLLDINLIDVANTKNVTTVAYMFDNCSSATRILLGDQFDTRNVTTTSHMFNECRSLQKISLGQYFDTRNVTDMSYMFCNCIAFHNYGGGQLDVGELFYTWKVEHFDYMFYNCQAHYLHFNSRFSIKSQYPYLATQYGIPTTVPTAENMMYHALAGSGRCAIFITSNTWSWINNASRTGITNSPDGWGTTGLPQIVVPLDVD